MRILPLIALMLMFIGPVWGQNLLKERIRKITPRKLSVFLESGIFHNGPEKRPSVLKKVRHNWSDKQGYERVVFDFGSEQVPKLYGNISGQQKKLYIDFFDTALSDAVNSLGNSKFVEGINFYPISAETLSVEVTFKTNVSLDVFYLDSPGRFVVDIKK